MTWAVILWLLGLGLSAFFSGSETGFYRVTRIRLVLDALEGDRIAKGLWWMINRPALFVATSLVGNNVANYVTSLAIVIGVHALEWSSAMEFVAPLVLSPVIFIYGELLPKKLFFQAPYRFLRRGGPLFLGCGVLFAPFSAVLWGFSKLLELVMGESHQQVQLRLARRELQSALDEGREVGVLTPAQRQLAQGLFSAAGESVMDFALPPQRMARAQLGMAKEDVLRLARRQRSPVLPVEDAARQRSLVGYLRVADVKLGPDVELREVRPLLAISATELHLNALMKMHAAGETLAKVVDEEDNLVGLLLLQRLVEPLLLGER
ncbi:MAG: DUF21 domain-containing protein [Pirellulales bacterium]|nr:DUF21 domain-containing protein [Pirellulales bacterium]